ncbi:MAG: hypothetical protein DRN06_02055 [Thermoprotei archaeon]|nr:MAG: hypothetical protein DRN06_02055 [Thermoprotei archaeon]
MDMRLPSILVGTSPFIGAGQFGSRASLYYEKFYGKPWNVKEVLEEAYLQGVEAVQALPFKHIYEAISLLMRQGLKLKVWGSLSPSNPEKGFDLFTKLEAEGIAIHGETSDSLNVEAIRDLIDRIKEAGCYAGMAVHSPGIVLPWLLEEDLEVDFLIVPFNKLGFFMDINPGSLLNLLRKVGKPAMAMKTLAAGTLSPREALEFVLSHPEFSSVAIGVASREEAAETFKVALELLGTKDLR